ncbi:MAG: DegT/DnrJ/EryC1/StrS aminotransferase family protein, partial [Mesorhizobium sp.]
MNKPADVSFVAGTTSTYDSMLARFGGTPAVPTGSVTPWPAPQKRHSKALKSVVTSGKYHRVNHPIVTAAEEGLSRWARDWEVRAVGSGTSAIHTALDYFRRDGGKVMTAAYNWPGAVGAISFSGMEPDFVDVDLDLAAIDQTTACQRLSVDTR